MAYPPILRRHNSRNQEGLSHRGNRIENSITCLLPLVSRASWQVRSPQRWRWISSKSWNTGAISQHASNVEHRKSTAAQSQKSDWTVASRKTTRGLWFLVKFFLYWYELCTTRHTSCRLVSLNSKVSVDAVSWENSPAQMPGYMRLCIRHIVKPQ